MKKYRVPSVWILTNPVRYHMYFYPTILQWLQLWQINRLLVLQSVSDLHSHYYRFFLPVSQRRCSTFHQSLVSGWRKPVPISLHRYDLQYYRGTEAKSTLPYSSCEHSMIFRSQPNPVMHSVSWERLKRFFSVNGDTSENCVNPLDGDIVTFISQTKSLRTCVVQ